MFVVGALDRRNAAAFVQYTRWLVALHKSWLLAASQRSLIAASQHWLVAASPRSLVAASQLSQRSVVKQHTQTNAGMKNRSLGLSAHLAWARLLIDRTNEQIKYPDAQSNNRKPRDSGDDEAIAHENYFNPESGFAASERTTGQSP